MNFPTIRYSMFAHTIIRFRCTSVVGNSSKEIAKVLSRIQVIENENECSEITQKIISPCSRMNLYLDIFVPLTKLVCLQTRLLRKPLIS